MPKIVNISEKGNYINVGDSGGGQNINCYPPVAFKDKVSAKEFLGSLSESYIARSNWKSGDGHGIGDYFAVPFNGNRFFGGSASAVTVQYSRDNGSTWTDYGASDSQKKQLLMHKKAELAIGKNTTNGNADIIKYQLRITIDAEKLSMYSEISKYVIEVTTNGSTDCWGSLDYAKYESPTTWKNIINKQSIAGWNGVNVWNVPKDIIGGNKSNHIRYIRFTFGCRAISDWNCSGMKISNISAYGGIGWKIPCKMAENGHLYDWDINNDAYFPHDIYSNGKRIGKTTCGTSSSVSGGKSGDIYIQY